MIQEELKYVATALAVATSNPKIERNIREIWLDWLELVSSSGYQLLSPFTTAKAGFKNNLVKRRKDWQGVKKLNKKKIEKIINLEDKQNIGLDYFKIFKSDLGLDLDLDDEKDNDTQNAATMDNTAPKIYYHDNEEDKKIVKENIFETKKKFEKEAVRRLKPSRLVKPKKGGLVKRRRKSSIISNFKDNETEAVFQNLDKMLIFGSDKFEFFKSFLENLSNIMDLVSIEYIVKRYCIAFVFNSFGNLKKYGFDLKHRSNTKQEINIMGGYLSLKVDLESFGLNSRQKIEISVKDYLERSCFFKFGIFCVDLFEYMNLIDNYHLRQALNIPTHQMPFKRLDLYQMMEELPWKSFQAKLENYFKVFLTFLDKKSEEIIEIEDQDNRIRYENVNNHGILSNKDNNKFDHSFDQMFINSQTNLDYKEKKGKFFY